MKRRDESNMEEHFTNDIVTALRKISAHYVVGSNTPNHLAERIFAYEFYHQYRMIMEENSKYDGMYLCGEQSKLYDNRQGGGERENLCPDIVLAGDIENVDENKQYWAMEIKMSGNPDWESDLPKLVKYAKKQLRFQSLFYIYVCENEESEKDISNKLKGRVFTTDENMIAIFICVPNTNGKLNVIKFKQK